MRIGLLTGGGDCAGLNAAIRSVVRYASEQGHEVIGFRRGWKGLIDNLVYPLNHERVSGILHVGGTILGSSRTNPSKIENGYDIVLDNLKKNKIDVLIVIGGDDTLSVADQLYKRGFKTIGIPKTMDNDVYGTEYCIGFDSAVSVVADALDRLHTTAFSHHRVMVVEVMGRDSGWVALFGGLAGGADWILIPEVEADVEEVCNHLERRRRLGKEFSIIVVAEGVKLSLKHLTESEAAEKVDAFGHIRLDKRGVGKALGHEIEERTGFETRVTVLGHVQRGGSPSVFDRILATRFGVRAVDAIKEEKFGKMVALTNFNKIELIDLDTVIKNSPRNVYPHLYKLAKIFY